MAVNLTTADSVLKSYYLDAVTEQLNNGISPFFAAIKKSTNNVWGKEVIKNLSYGVTGGVVASSEDGTLPSASNVNYAKIVMPLKNIYGTIEISDKALRASENNSNAFINLLNIEMEGLVKSATRNFDRMLFGNGSGELGRVISTQPPNMLLVDTAANFEIGMEIEFRNIFGEPLDSPRLKVIDINFEENKVCYAGEYYDESYFEGAHAYPVGSYNQELTGLKAIFGPEVVTLYGYNVDENLWLRPRYVYKHSDFNEMDIMKMLDDLEARSGRRPNMILTSLALRRKIYELLVNNNKIVDSTTIEGGYTALNYNGVPIVASRYCPEKSIYFLNTDDFELHQLCDWEWLADDDGRVLKQVPGRPVYSATLVKYAELICNRPGAQGELRLASL